MSLDALAPDQRAVVQLVLQQDRSYDELAGLLGISADAVRERARRGLDRLAPADGLDEDERGDIADYLLGQQTVSGSERTRSMLAGNPSAAAWAGAVAAELQDVARAPLPEVPGATVTDTALGGPGVAAAGRAPAAAEGAAQPDAAGATPLGDAPRRRPRPEPAAAATEDEPDETAVRARPRPERGRPGEARRRAATTAPATAVAGGPAPPAATGSRRSAQEPPRSSRLGGAILLGLALVLVAGVVIYLVARGSDDDGGDRASSAPTPAATATATATSTSEFQALGRVPLEAPQGGDATGEMIIFASQSGGLAFTIQGTKVPPSGRGEAYAVWLTGGGADHRLGYAPQVGEDGKLGASGPRESDQEKFARWFTQARRVVVSKETQEGTASPGPIVLQGTVPRDGGSASGSG